jgi:hypothetical protein
MLVRTCGHLQMEGLNVAPALGPINLGRVKLRTPCRLTATSGIIRFKRKLRRPRAAVGENPTAGFESGAV